MQEQNNIIIIISFIFKNLSKNMCDPGDLSIPPYPPMHVHGAKSVMSVMSMFTAYECVICMVIMVIEIHYLTLDTCIMST